MNHLQKVKIKNFFLSIFFICITGIVGLFIFAALSGCSAGTKARTAAVLLKIEKVSCDVLDKVCKYKDFVCNKKLKSK
jgi:hypothetical protein